MLQTPLFEIPQRQQVEMHPVVDQFAFTHVPRMNFVRPEAAIQPGMHNPQPALEKEEGADFETLVVCLTKHNLRPGVSFNTLCEG